MIIINGCLVVWSLETILLNIFVNVTYHQERYMDNV